MRWLIFLSRVAFICGIVMTLALISLAGNFINSRSVSSNILAADYGLGIIMVPLVCFLYAVTYLLQKHPQHYVPKWLIWCNVAFLTILFAYNIIFK